MGMVARSRAERRSGDWISIAAHLERAPLRFAFTIAFGELPEGWDESGRRASTWAGIVGLLLLTPFIAGGDGLVEERRHRPALRMARRISGRDHRGDHQPLHRHPGRDHHE